jgi:catechol 2,3-dioxygenase-like lactoylglutathione lyase family enzyme
MMVLKVMTVASPDKRALERASVPPRLAAVGLATKLLVLGIAALGSGPLAARQPASPAEADAAGFHHVHLRVIDPERTLEFYRRNFGALPIRYRDRADALFVERSFLFLERVDEPPSSALETGLWHIGWGSPTVAATEKWLLGNGVVQETPLYTIPGSGTEVTYWRGPDGELIEVNTTGHHRFGHVHMFASDVNATTAWFSKHLGQRTRRAEVPKPADYSQVRAWSNGFTVDNVQVIVYGAPDREPLPPWWSKAPILKLQPTRGHVIDHIAFSYRDLDAAFQRFEDGGARIIAPPAVHPELGFRSFFVEAPDGVLIEIVEERPIPEGIWD